MATSLDAPKTGFPSIRFREIGQYIDVAIFKIERKPVTDLATGAPKLKDNGQPRQQEVVSGLVIRSTAMIVTDRDVVPEPGSSVSIWFAGGHWGALIEAQKQLGGEGRKVGDVMRVTYTGNEPNKVAGMNDSKIWSVQIRRPKPEESALADRCEAAARGPATALDDEPF